MKSRMITLSTTLLCLFAVSTLMAGEVKITDSHLCCGKCLKAANGALKGVTGVSAVVVDKSSSSITFTATNDTAAQAGVDALAASGLGGKATHAKKNVDFPSMGAKKGAKSNTVTFGGVHLCCGKCVKAAKGAFGGVTGCQSVSVDKSAGTVTLEGKDISHASAADALLGAGFFGKVK